jgi:hypothetical protein
MKKYNLNSAITSALRRAWRFYPERLQAISDSKVDSKHVICAHCQNLVNIKLAKCDHIEPVIPPEGTGSWDVKIERLFCPKRGYQILCENCHDEKTKEERDAKKTYRTLMRKPKNAKKGN